jgi:hypothetical protein
MIALLGTVALGTFDRSLDRHLADAGPSPALAQAVENARGGFVIPPMPAGLSGAEREQARAIIASALGDTVRLALWIACALSLASALVSALTLSSQAPLTAADRPAHPS